MMWRLLVVQCLVFVQVTRGQEDKFQKCCGEEKLYSPIDKRCHYPTDQGPCKRGEWIVMDKGADVGACKKSPCGSNQEILVAGSCRSKYDLSNCARGKRPWYSVYGEWECMRHRVFLPFGQQKEPYDKTWDRCNNKADIIVT